MLKPAGRDATDGHIVDRLFERNARLVTQLRRVVAQLHRQQRHDGFKWTECRDETCERTRALIEKNEIDKNGM